ncbi:MAG: RNA 2',3'-cyclic phosphodiesterase [Bacillota bacterium]
MVDTKRVFIAVKLDNLVKEKLNKVQQMLRDCSCNIKWVKKSKFHITLKFLGDITIKKIEKIKQELKENPLGHTSFSCTIDELGAFPDKEQPQVIWAGISENSQPLIDLQQTVENKMIELGFDKEQHSYTPHITLGRVRKEEKNKKKISQKIKEFPFKIQAEQVVDKIAVIESKLTAQGPIYNSLAEIELN